MPYKEIWRLIIFQQATGPHKLLQFIITISEYCHPLLGFPPRGGSGFRKDGGFSVQVSGREKLMAKSRYLLFDSYLLSPISFYNE
jgi:hypothetical protein